jgi:hypothetical protein
MHKDTYTKVVLTIIALSLAVLAVEQWIASDRIANVSAAPAISQKWEYKRIGVESFHMVARGSSPTYYDPVYESKWYEDGIEHKGDADISDIYSRLGALGWELVTITPDSEYASYNNAGYEQVNGTTSYILYVFKRPKP